MLVCIYFIHRYVLMKLKIDIFNFGEQTFTVLIFNRIKIISPLFLALVLVHFARSHKQLLKNQWAEQNYR